VKSQGLDQVERVLEHRLFMRIAIEQQRQRRIHGV
jgi:hypothetical protein